MMTTSRDILTWLEGLLALPPLKLTAAGGGIPSDAARSELALEFEHVVLAARRDVDDAVRVLRTELDPYNTLPVETFP